MVAASCKWLAAFWISSFFMFGENNHEIPISLRHNNYHPFHVSVTEINHNATDKTLEISCKVFTDDFEDALGKKFKEKVDLVHPKVKADMDRILGEYIREHLLIKADNKSLVLNYLGFEVESEAVFMYLQVSNIASVRRIDAVNTILQDMFNDQTEIMHVSVGGNRKSLKIDYPNSQASFQF